MDKEKFIKIMRDRVFNDEDIFDWIQRAEAYALNPATPEIEERYGAVTLEKIAEVNPMPGMYLGY